MNDTKTPTKLNKIGNESPYKVSYKTPIVFALFTLISLLIMTRSSNGKTIIQFNGKDVAFSLPQIIASSQAFSIGLCVIMLAVTGASFFLAQKNIKDKKLVILPVIFWTSWVLNVLSWQYSGNANPIVITSLLAGAVLFATPLIFGGLSGVVCERVGVINIAIEGQLLFGAFLSSYVANLTHSAYVGLIAAPIAGASLGLLIVIFCVKYAVDQIIVGVVVNVLALGITTYLYATVFMKDNAITISAFGLPKMPIPLLCNIPIIGEVLFNENILVYLMIAILIVLQIMLFKSKWGLRLRACGEHPMAADTLGINVNRTRVINTLIGSGIAGLGGAFFTVSQELAFAPNMTSGKGYIALAAMIMGRWSPKGVLAAALLFGFADAAQLSLTSIGASIPSQFIQMIPYIVAIVCVAGLVGKSRPPAAEGKAYINQ